MEKKRTKRQAGFTLVELLVSLVLSSVIMLATYSVYRVQMHTGKVQENRLVAQEYARNVVDMMVREIRNAGYAPTGAPCAVVVSADAETIQFRYDANGNNVCTDPDEDITYSYVTIGSGCAPGFGDITRNGNGNPLTECNVTNLDMRYFRQDGTEITRPVAAGDLPNIQRVLITLTVQSKNPDGVFGGQLNATMTSNADLRNRGLQ
jgi:prepilin-type N-terminal cleavage/methylation domain-containing protein